MVVALLRRAMRMIIGRSLTPLNSSKPCGAFAVRWSVGATTRAGRRRMSLETAVQDAGIRVVQTPYRAPNANAYAERFVRSIKEECLNRLIPFGEHHHRRAVAEFVAVSIENAVLGTGVNPGELSARSETWRVSHFERLEPGAQAVEPRRRVCAAVADSTAEQRIEIAEKYNVLKCDHSRIPERIR